MNYFYKRINTTKTMNLPGHISYFTYLQIVNFSVVCGYNKYKYYNTVFI
jgi:hypothetical protein